MEEARRKRECFNCGSTSHIASRCKKPRSAPANANNESVAMGLKDMEAQVKAGFDALKEHIQEPPVPQKKAPVRPQEGIDPIVEFEVRDWLGSVRLHVLHWFVPFLPWVVCLAVGAVDWRFGAAASLLYTAVLFELSRGFVAPDRNNSHLPVVKAPMWMMFRIAAYQMFRSGVAAKVMKRQYTRLNLREGELPYDKRPELIAQSDIVHKDPLMSDWQCRAYITLLVMDSSRSCLYELPSPEYEMNSLQVVMTASYEVFVQAVNVRFAQPQMELAEIHSQVQRYIGTLQTVNMDRYELSAKILTDTTILAADYIYSVMEQRYFLLRGMLRLA